MRLPFLVPLFLVSSLPFAQQITLRGKVEDVGPGFIVDCTDTQLTSSAFDLNAFVGQHVLIGGTRIGAGNPPLVSVTSIAVTPEIFEIPGNPEIGDTVRFGAIHTPGSQVFFRAALGSGFQPAGSLGTYFLDPATDVAAASGIIPAPGDLELAVALPNDPALIGLTIHGQAIVRTPGGFLLSNPDCKDIQ
jgi:hypothetical protein